MSKTHWKKVVSDPNYIGEADFEPKEEKIVTIKTINQCENVKTAEGNSKKAVVHFVEAGIKPMILNVARSKSIEKVSGSGYFEDWPGTKIQLYIESGIKAFGETVSAVRVRKFKPKEQTAPIPPCTDCKKPITQAGDKTPRFMADYTTKHFGVPLCADCAKKHKAKQDAEKEETRNETDE